MTYNAVLVSGEQSESDIYIYVYIYKHIHKHEYVYIHIYMVGQKVCYRYNIYDWLKIFL